MQSFYSHSASISHHPSEGPETSVHKGMCCWEPDRSKAFLEGLIQGQKKTSLCRCPGSDLESFSLGMGLASKKLRLGAFLPEETGVISSRVSVCCLQCSWVSYVPLGQCCLINLLLASSYHIPVSVDAVPCLPEKQYKMMYLLINLTGIRQSLYKNCQSKLFYVLIPWSSSPLSGPCH